MKSSACLACRRRVDSQQADQQDLLHRHFLPRDRRRHVSRVVHCRETSSRFLQGRIACVVYVASRTRRLWRDPTDTGLSPIQSSLPHKKRVCLIRELTDTEEASLRSFIHPSRALRRSIGWLPKRISRRLWCRVWRRDRECGLSGDIPLGMSCGALDVIIFSGLTLPLSKPRRRGWVSRLERGKGRRDYRPSFWK